MSTAVWPPIPPHEIVKEEEATLARELEWLLTSFQETFASLKSGLEECIALLAPNEPGSTLVVSTLRSESVKGFVTRVGTRITKAEINLRLSTLPVPRPSTSYPLRLSTLPSAPSLVLSQLTSVRNLINQSLDIVDTSTWTGDAHDANFIAGQLRLLSDCILEARQMLKGGEEVTGSWWENPIDENTFTPPLPPPLSIQIHISDASLLLTLRTLHLQPPPSHSHSHSHTHPPSSSSSSSNNPATDFALATLATISIRQRLGLAAPPPPRHDESDRVFAYRGQEVKVREKIRVESQDPSLMAVMAKLSAVQHGVGVARRSLGVVMGVGEGEGDD